MSELKICTDCGLRIRATELVMMGDHPYHDDCFDTLVEVAQSDRMLRDAEDITGDA